MVTATQTTFLIGKSLAELEELVVQWGFPKFRAKQLYKWIYSKSERDPDKMTDLAPKMRELLKDPESGVAVGSLKLNTFQKSVDGTMKFLFELQNGSVIESVLMHFDRHDSYSACISSQVGCAVACPFCATGTLGFKSNLKSSEIIEQILFMQNKSGERVSNVVYMGQGEPLNNYDAVVESLDKLRHDVGIGARHLTVSTSGVIPKIDQLADEGVQLTLALSLHDPTNEGRDYMVPINKKWPVYDVIESCKRFVDKTNRRVTIEYIMVDGKNDSPEKAKILANLIKDLHCNINLIPYNTTDVNDPFQRSTNASIKEFVRILEKYSKGKKITVRRERGHDIDAACGQLANRV